ncbi:MAG TPA: sugar ABC transporter permease [Chloroflexota bacterium]|jgi:multiple sugar transport system permease protein|nr:sugar ABC transporter permease [Chloroflexota bacterium]
MEAVAAPARRRRYSGLARREAIEGYLFILPWILGLLFFTLGPFLAGFLFSLTDYSALEEPRFVGLQNYATVFADPKFRLSVYNTAYYVFLSVPLNMLVGLLLAILLNQKVRGVAFFRTVFYMPAIVPAVPSIALFIWILHDRFGLLNGFLFSLGLPGPHWLTGPEWTKPALILWTLWQAGGGMIIYLAGLQGVPQELYEAASIDGAGVLRRFWHVTLPMISPTMFFVLTMGIIGSFQVFTAAFILGASYDFAASAGPLDSLLFWVLYIYHQGFFFFKFGYASALAWMLFVVILVVTLLQLWLSKRWVYYEAETPGR